MIFNRETIRLAAISTLVVGGKYVNRKGEVITIGRELAPGDPDYNLGWRFHGTEETPKPTPYTSTGRLSLDNQDNEYDLIGQLPDDFIETIETQTTVVKLPGLFSRVGAKIKRNPKKTIAGVAIGGAGAYGGYNYYNYGTPLPQNAPRTDGLRDAAAAVTAFLFR